jgi:glyoxylase-like metal-dependent hydrolase (beta-lactamase superfamily II)
MNETLIETDQPWFEVRRFPHGVTMIREPNHAEDVKSYLIEGSRDVAVLDTGLGVGDFAGLVQTLSPRRSRVLQTHAHWDHIGASHDFADVLVHSAEADVLRAGYPSARYRAKFSPAEVQAATLPAGFDPSLGLPGRQPTGWLRPGDAIDLGGRVLDVLHTPGHSPGGVSFLDRAARALFVGDLLYHGKMYVFFPTNDAAAFRAALHLIDELVDQVDAVYPAHGPAPLRPSEVHEIRAAFDAVWTGRPADREGMHLGYDVTIYDFGTFSFLLPRGDWRVANST